MKNRKTPMAFGWIINLLRKHKIQFQIAGGLAARAYGARRELADIDIDIDTKDFKRLNKLLVGHIVYGHTRYRDHNWNAILMTARYENQLIDLVDKQSVKIFDHDTKRWIPYHSHFSTSVRKKIFDLIVPVENRNDLVWNKRALQRRVDRKDLATMKLR